MIRRPRPALVMLLAVLGACGNASAAPVYEDRVDDYVVVSGDTINGITRRLLGEETFWEDNWKLNPQVRDPNLLRIGQRLRIIYERKVIAEAARVMEAVNRTEKMVTRPRWQPASSGDTLGSGQGLRTREKSTAELRFNAESSLRLGEFSQVFLASKETSLRGVDRGSITVEQGDVDLVFAPLAKPKTQIEIVAGPSRTTPVVSAGKATEIRTGATADGGARVMVFAGNSDVSSGGEAVSVAHGMGTRVPESGPPKTPEKLLSAPEVEASSQRWPYSNGLLRWSRVDGAARYQVTLCSDQECTQPIATVISDDAVLQVTPLPLGTAYWRVLAVSASGLDGYSSETANVEVTDARPDLLAPMLALEPVAGFVSGKDGATRLGPNAQLRVVAYDEQAGVESIEARRGDASWKPLDPPMLSINELLGDSDSAVELRATDRLGQVSPTLKLDLQVEPAEALQKN